MGWLIVAGAPVAVFSYLGAPVASPLHPLWGTEFFALVAIGIAGGAAAWTAGHRWPIWSRVLLGCTIVVLALGALAFGYWPHGSLVFLSAEVVALILARPPTDGALE